MDTDRAKQIRDALDKASAAYQAAAEDEMNGARGGYGSVHNVFNLMRESYSIQGKSRNLARRFGVDSCNCA